MAKLIISESDIEAGRPPGAEQIEERARVARVVAVVAMAMLLGCVPASLLVAWLLLDKPPTDLLVFADCVIYAWPVLVCASLLLHKAVEDKKCVSAVSGDECVAAFELCRQHARLAEYQSIVADSGRQLVNCELAAMRAWRDGVERRAACVALLSPLRHGLGAA